MTNPSTRIPAQGVMKLRFDRPFLGHHYYALSMSESCVGVERKREIVKGKNACSLYE